MSIEIEERVQKFKEAIKKVCIDHQMIMLPDDGYCGFSIDKYYEKGMEILMRAYIDYDLEKGGE